MGVALDVDDDADVVHAIKAAARGAPGGEVEGEGPHHQRGVCVFGALDLREHPALRVPAGEVAGAAGLADGRAIDALAAAAELAQHAVRHAGAVLQRARGV
ncbi:MAG: hypothetical protein ACK56I_36605, partial [bacterium]